MGEPSPSFKAVMDDEQVCAAAESSAHVTSALFELFRAQQPMCRAELEEISQQVAEVLHAVLSWKPNLDAEDHELFAALERWLP